MFNLILYFLMRIPNSPKATSRFPQYNMFSHHFSSYGPSCSKLMMSLVGLNIFISFYNYTSIQTYMMIIQAMGLERKLKAYKVLLPTYKVLLPVIS